MTAVAGLLAFADAAAAADVQRGALGSVVAGQRLRSGLGHCCR